MTESRFKSGVALFIAVCLTASLLILVKTFWPAAGKGVTPKAGKQAAAPAGEELAPGRKDLANQILARDLFGLKGEAAPTAAAQAKPQASTLDYDLIGTVVHSDPQKSVAILRSRSSKAQRAYTEGRVVGDAVVKKIGPNYVIFDRQGREEILTMKP